MLKTKGKRSANLLVHLALRAVALGFSNFSKLKKYLKTDEGWINFSIGIRTESRSVVRALKFHDGKVSVLKNIPEKVNVELVFIDEETLLQMAKLPPNEIFYLVLKNKLIIHGNLAYLQLFTFLLSVINGKRQIKQMAKQGEEIRRLAQSQKPLERPPLREDKYLKGKNKDENVLYLDDPYLSEYSLQDFPRLEKFLDIHFNHKPAICTERVRLLTHWYKENGFEVDKNGEPWFPELRQGFAFKYLMEQKSLLFVRMI